MPNGSWNTRVLRFFRAFSSVVRQMPGYNSHRRGTPHILPKLIVLFCVFFVCKRVLYYSHRVSTQMQLTNISIWTSIVWGSWKRCIQLPTLFHEIWTMRVKKKRPGTNLSLIEIKPSYIKLHHTKTVRRTGQWLCHWFSRSTATRQPDEKRPKSKCNVYIICRQTQLSTRWYANLLNVNLNYMFRPQSLAIIGLYKRKLIN